MKLYYRHYGTGEPVIILHGLFGLSDNWVTHAKRLAENFSVYLPDLRNHGHSPHSPSFNFDAMADDLLEFIEEHQLINPAIIGHSLGGKVAMLFALEHPELVKKLLVVDISPVRYENRDAHFDIISAMMSINFEAIHSREEVSNLLETSIPHMATRLFILKNLYRKTRHNFDWRINLSAINTNMDRISESINSSTVYNGNTLFIRGGRSEYILDSHLPTIKMLFPEYNLETIDKAGHWVHADAPEEIFLLINNFLLK